jgi:hypothetical protein
MGAAAALRAWQLGGRPGFDWDEPVYSYVATSILHGHGLHAKPSFGVVQQPYLYHPPFYFYLLAGWFKAFGAGIAQARALGATASLITLVLLYALMRPRWGVAALVPLALLGTDGWLLFTNRVSWIENVMFVLVAAGMLAYDRGLRSRSPRAFVVAGALLGLAIIFKHLAAFAVVAVLINWALTREQPREHRRLLKVVGAIVLTFVVALTAFSQVHGHNVFLSDSWVQLERVAGQKAARGSIGGSAVLEAVAGRYKVFAPTLGLSALALALLAIRCWQIARRRTTSAVPDPMLFSWAIAAALAFGALKLKMAHYFMMIEVPLLLYLASEAAAWLDRRRARAASTRRLTRVAITVALGLLIANLVTFDRRFVSRTDNALAGVRAFMSATADPHALVATEESVGSIISQPYCKFTKIGACFRQARYLIVYRSTTQAPPDKPLLNSLLRYATPLQTFSGFKERITVYESPGIGPTCASSRFGRAGCDPHLELVAQTRLLRQRSRYSADVRFGTYPRLRHLRFAGALTVLPSAQAPALLLLGLTRDSRALFWNVGRAQVSGDVHCLPTPGRCSELSVREGGSVHLRVPTVTGRPTEYDLKVDNIRSSARAKTGAVAGRRLLDQLAARRPVTLSAAPAPRTR